MKKLGKLTINPDKIIKNEELVNLRGGSEGYAGACTLTNDTCSGGCPPVWENGNLVPSSKTCQDDDFWYGGIKIRACSCK